MKDSKKMEGIFKKSIKEIESVLDEVRPITDITKLAASTLSNYAKIRQTESHNDAIKLAREKLRLPEIE
jgi:hypothetical protein